MTKKQSKLPDSMYYILIALTEPMHGYAAMKYIETLTRGEISIGAGTLYTTLTKLQENKWIVERKDLPVEDERRIPYSLTPTGAEALQNEIDRRNQQVLHGTQHLENWKEEK
ncbi:MAG: helix-turn-helix transcriptional regulator [Anaerolineaceae bacterium]|nr:helix-turn-helix transcriptional regulator [Anaerolineaceae bacterium]